MNAETALLGVRYLDNRGRLRVRPRDAMAADGPEILPSSTHRSVSLVLTPDMLRGAPAGCGISSLGGPIAGTTLVAAALVSMRRLDWLLFVLAVAGLIGALVWLR